MNKLDQEEIADILANAEKLENKLGWLQEAVTQVHKSYSLPDFIELQKYDESAKVGYLIEDIEICVANIDQEISDALNKIERLRKAMKKS